VTGLVEAAPAGEVLAAQRPQLGQRVLARYWGFGREKLFEAVTEEVNALALCAVDADAERVSEHRAAADIDGVRRHPPALDALALDTNWFCLNLLLPHQCNTLSCSCIISIPAFPWHNAKMDWLSSPWFYIADGLIWLLVIEWRRWRRISGRETANDSYSDTDEKGQ